MDCNKVSHYLLKLDQFIKYVKDISGKKLATCIIKPPKVAKELAKLTENHCGGRLEFNDKDFKNGVFACLGEMNDEPFYEVWEPWWPLKTGSIEVGNRFSTEDIIKSVPETLHGVIIIRADNAVFATIGNNYKQIGEPATMDLTNMKIIKSFPSMKKVSGLYIFHEADLANVNDMIEVLKHFDPKSKPKVHEFQPDADDVVSVQAGFFDEISAPVVEDWISIRSILANPEGYIFEPRRVIQVLKHGGFKGKVFIWKENNLRVFKYSDVKAKEDGQTVQTRRERRPDALRLPAGDHERFPLPSPCDHD